MGRILAIDPGDRRAGLALTDPLGIIASPHGSLDARDTAKLVRRVAEVVAAAGVELVLVGFPGREDGYEGAGCRRSRRLLAALQAAGLPARLWDESGTTREALEVTRAHGLSARRSRHGRDAVAASLILADYLRQAG